MSCLWELADGKKFQLVTKVYPKGDGYTFIKLRDESDNDRVVARSINSDREENWNPYCEVVEVP